MGVTEEKDLFGYSSAGYDAAARLAALRGSICEEIERILNMRHQTASARRTDLRAAGYTEFLRDANGQVLTRPTSTGSPAKVEIATQKGIAAVDFNLPLQLKNRDPTRNRHGGSSTSAAAFGLTLRSQDARRVLEVMRRLS